jgi:hypothetical protein
MHSVGTMRVTADGKLHILCEQGYIILCASNLTKGESCARTRRVCILLE